MDDIKTLFPEFFWDKNDTKNEEYVPNLTHPEDHEYFIAQRRLASLLEEKEKPKRYVPPKKHPPKGLLDIAKHVTTV